MSQTIPYQTSHAVAEARSLRGDPVKNDLLGQTVAAGNKFITVRGQYNAAPNASGKDVYVVPDGKGGQIRTTDNPAKARYDTSYTFAQALEYLHQKYPKVPRGKLRAALFNMGWKSDGKRPAKKKALPTRPPVRIPGGMHGPGIVPPLAPLHG